MSIYLTVNGSRLAPEIIEADQFVFRLDLPAHEIRLLSGHARPADIDGGDDYRRVGVGLRELLWQKGARVIESPIASPGFIDGFHHVEQHGETGYPFRWTTGDAGLPPGVFPAWEGEVLLRIRVVHSQGSRLNPPPRPEAALLSAFENLGENCAFSLAQRHYGAEPPLSLLRWAGTNYEKLLNGLENRFLGLGEPDTTSVVWRDSEYRLQTPYLALHTTANQELDEARVAEILREGRATLRLLRRKLLKDIADAKRIFVFQTADPSFGRPEMHGLHNALRSIGPASLLCVTWTEPGRRIEGPEHVTDGLYAGCLESSTIKYGPCDEWLALCSRTLALHHGAPHHGG
jgi:hypothetical protein